MRTCNDPYFAEGGFILDQFTYAFFYQQSPDLFSLFFFLINYRDIAGIILLSQFQEGIIFLALMINCR